MTAPVATWFVTWNAGKQETAELGAAALLELATVAGVTNLQSLHVHQGLFICLKTFEAFFGQSTL